MYRLRLNFIDGGWYMDDITKKDLADALQAIASMISRTEKAKMKFAQGTSQHTLLMNRLKSLQIISSLITKELTESVVVDCAKEDLEKALAPIASLISKSEKAQAKLAPDTWQHSMLSSNLKALYVALPLLSRMLSYGL